VTFPIKYRKGRERPGNAKKGGGSSDFKGLHEGRSRKVRISGMIFLSSLQQKERGRGGGRLKKKREEGEEDLH